MFNSFMEGLREDHRKYLEGMRVIQEVHTLVDIIQKNGNLDSEALSLRIGSMITNGGAKYGKFEELHETLELMAKDFLFPSKR